MHKGGAEVETLTTSPRQRKPHTTTLTPDLRSPLLPPMEEWQLTLHWQPEAHQQAQFQQLYALTLAGNRQFNLTRITEPAEFWEKHLWDSLRGVQRFLHEDWESGGRRQKAEGAGEAGAAEEEVKTHLSSLTSFKVIDIGTGAGFPGLPVAIAQPNWTVTLLDATRKKITFIDQVIAHMGLTNATTLVERVEQVGQQRLWRQAYDLALIRAVAAAPVCAEYALPLLKVGGCAVLYRGQWSEAETTSLEAAVAVLGGKIDAIEAFTTPLTQGDRHCIYLKKIAPTPNEFPRAIGIPAQKPLGLELDTEA
ncbi:16S rRNA (guanine(527)-N(7))-methyltransferase RsmG [Leptolyngbya sp. FACHB-321]|nr:16S rRNA (guanine(527)-N(7))-methyltransferase RsmG [Leptolyngbya sp. FACHB-321]